MIKKIDNQYTDLFEEEEKELLKTLGNNIIKSDNNDIKNSETISNNHGLKKLQNEFKEIKEKLLDFITLFDNRETTDEIYGRIETIQILLERANKIFNKDNLLIIESELNDLESIVREYALEKMKVKSIELQTVCSDLEFKYIDSISVRNFDAIKPDQFHDYLCAHEEINQKNIEFNKMLKSDLINLVDRDALIEETSYYVESISNNCRIIKERHEVQKVNSIYQNRICQN